MKYSKQHIIEKDQLNNTFYKYANEIYNFLQKFLVKKILFLIFKIENKTQFLKNNNYTNSKFKPTKIIPTLQVLLL